MLLLMKTKKKKKNQNCFISKNRSGLSSIAAVSCNMKSKGRAYNAPFFLSYVLMFELGLVLYLCLILGYFCIG